MAPIIPTVFAQNKFQFKKRFSKLIKISKNIQIDFMDGKFVKSKSVKIRQIPNLKIYPNNFEAHLMTKNPEKSIIQLKQKGFKKVIFHIESTKNSGKIIKKIKSQKMQAWLAINPETPLKSIIPYTSKVQGILFLGVKPGKEHQSFIPQVYKKIQALRKINNKIPIQVDGGINNSTLPKLAKLKVNYINSGSFISDSKNPKQTYKNLVQLFNTLRGEQC